MTFNQRSKQMLRSGGCTFILWMIMTFLLLSTPAFARDMIIDSDQGPLFPELQKRAAGLPGAGRLPAKAPGEYSRVPGSLVIFKVRDVRNISGNNPIHQRQPLLNYNGKVVSTLDDLLALIRGGGGGGGGGDASDCTGTVEMKPVSGSGFPADDRFASFTLNKVTGDCTRPLKGDMKGKTVHFISNPDPAGDELCICPSTAGDNWHISSPAGDPHWQCFPFGSVQVIRLKSPSGLEVEIKFSTSGNMLNPFLTIHYIKNI